MEYKTIVLTEHLILKELFSWLTHIMKPTGNDDSQISFFNGNTQHLPSYAAEIHT